jgi:hypothetical protein
LPIVVWFSLTLIDADEVKTGDSSFVSVTLMKIKQLLAILQLQMQMQIQTLSIQSQVERMQMILQ